jgi:hypothetical protein
MIAGMARSHIYGNNPEVIDLSDDDEEEEEEDN